MKRAFFFAILPAAGLFTFGQAAASPERVMFIVGCLAEEDGGWVLTNATDPTPVAGLPGSKTENEPSADVPLGKNRFSLIGTVSEFGVEKLKGHKVRVKGLVIEAASESRVNLTSLKMLGTGCK